MTSVMIAKVHSHAYFTGTLLAAPTFTASKSRTRHSTPMKTARTAMMTPSGIPKTVVLLTARMSTMPVTDSAKVTR